MENINMSYNNSPLHNNNNNNDNNNDNINNTNTFEVTEIQESSSSSKTTNPNINLEFKVDNEGDKFNKQVMDYVKTYKPLLYILTPCYNGTCDINYTLSLLKTIELFNRFNFTVNVLFCRNDSLITRARNNLVAKAMSDPKTTHIMFIDNDITWSALDVLKLVLANKPIIGGVYPLKKYDWNKLLVDRQNPYNSNVVQSLLDKYESSILKNSISRPDYIQASLLDYNINFLNPQVSITNNIAAVRHVATGFMMLHRKMIEDMMKQYSHTKYTDDTGFLLKDENKYAYALFNCDVGYDHFLSEDWLFCDRWVKLGGEIFIDVSISLNHTGTNDFKGCFLTSII